MLSGFLIKQISPDKRLKHKDEYTQNFDKTWFIFWLISIKVLTIYSLHQWTRCLKAFNQSYLCYRQPTLNLSHGYTYICAFGLGLVEVLVLVLTGLVENVVGDGRVKVVIVGMLSKVALSIFSKFDIFCRVLARIKLHFFIFWFF